MQYPERIKDLRSWRKGATLANPCRRFSAKPKRCGNHRKVKFKGARFQEKLLKTKGLGTYLKPKQVDRYDCTKANG
ncbi:MAG: hypothetical protein CEN90_416 [Parcubacteria group bacterium Licking1014_17]|nr:MAG: hypothetical protein CEN90_416 [Parcubacteria group bacterium Licking1014_17]